MKEHFEQLAKDNDWEFLYAPKSYQNIYEEMQENKLHFFMEPLTINSKFDDFGIETPTYNGKLFLAYSSDIDEDYEVRYEKYIKPIILGGLQLLKESLSTDCGTSYRVDSLSTTEVINLFNYNLDGLYINYSITDV